MSLSPTLQSLAHPLRFLAATALVWLLVVGWLASCTRLAVAETRQ